MYFDHNLKLCVQFKLSWLMVSLSMVLKYTTHTWFTVSLMCSPPAYSIFFFILCFYTLFWRDWVKEGHCNDNLMALFLGCKLSEISTLGPTKAEKQTITPYHLVKLSFQWIESVRINKLPKRCDTCLLQFSDRWKMMAWMDRRRRWIQCKSHWVCIQWRSWHICEIFWGLLTTL